MTDFVRVSFPFSMENNWAKRKDKENQQRNLQESKHNTKWGLGFLEISLFEGVTGLERVWSLNSSDSLGMAMIC